ncbi:MAG: hypothetical protein R2795_05890 [Saprospiraceae bacterium]
MSWALKHAGWIFAGTFILLFAAQGLFEARKPKVELFPSADPIYVNLFVELPLGTDITKTDEVLMEMEKRVLKTIEPYSGIVEAVLTQIGEDTADPSYHLNLMHPLTAPD